MKYAGCILCVNLSLNSKGQKKKNSPLNILKRKGGGGNEKIIAKNM